MRIEFGYRRIGLPGCAGSTDCVHIGWDRCPAELRSVCVGKEGFPTVSYEVTVDHNKKIIALTPSGFFGSINDKTIVRFDGYVRDIRHGQVVADLEFTLVNESGAEFIEKGLYLIVDGGYHRWRCLQCPNKWSDAEWEALWFKFIESTRKDVECTFGIVKGRFRILKTRMLFQSKERIDNVFVTCAFLHNLLHDYDNRGGPIDAWETGVEWDGADGLHDPDDMLLLDHRRRQYLGPEVVGLRDNSDESYVGRDHLAVPDLHVEEEAGHFDLRKKLVAHYKRKVQDEELRALYGFH